ncbi:MAG TPA: tetratricopeptide repeat protein [Sphingomicrobium sp.]|nr:tetratricopeptide repeat protein [Sphingomicrobium sp.]
MAFRSKALTASLALGLAAASAPALAQGASQAPQIKISPQASKAIVALQTAVTSNDLASVPTKLAAAQAVAKTNQDRYAIGQLWLRAALLQKDNAATSQAIDQVLASGLAPADVLANLRFNQAKLKFQAKDYAGANAALQTVLASPTTNSDVFLLAGELAAAQGQNAQAVEHFRKAIAVKTASGQPVPGEWMGRAVSLAYRDKLPVLSQLLPEWIMIAPTSTNVRDAVRLQAELSGQSPSEQIDLYRLQRAAGALKGEGDYFNYANSAALKGLPGEAKAVLDEGFAAKAIDRSRPVFRDVYASASSKVAGDKASLGAAERSALSAAAARPAMVTGDAYLGYGDYAKAATLYRAALTKSGADTNLANLRLGIALARSGDKAGATAAFNAVSGTHQATAKLWLAWLASRS